MKKTIAVPVFLMSEINVEDEVTDGRLMAKAAGGDRIAFDQIVARYQNRVQRFAIRMAGGNATHGADIAVGAFLRLWECRRTYLESGCLSAWLYRTTYRIYLDLIKQERPSELLDEQLSDPHFEPEKRFLGEAVRIAVSELPEAQRAVLILTVYEGLSYDEAAEVLGIPPGTVASRKNHALSVLRRRLAAWEEIR